MMHTYTGAFAESPLGALFIFKAESEAAVKASFVEKDPYVSNGLVVEHTVRELLIPPGLY